MTSIFLVRHAATAWSGRRYCGRSDPPLGAIGRTMAARLAAELGPTLPPDARILSSPSRRARETAASIAAAAGIPTIAVDERWYEADLGIAEGLTFEAVEALDPDLARRLADGESEIDWPEGESSDALASRVGAAWRDLLTTGQDTLVVSHAGPLRLAIGLARGAPPRTIAFPEPGSVIRLAV